MNARKLPPDRYPRRARDPAPHAALVRAGGRLGAGVRLRAARARSKRGRPLTNGFSNPRRSAKPGNSNGRPVCRSTRPMGTCSS